MIVGPALADITPAPAPDLERQFTVEQFLFHEARLLDGQRFEEWLDLFTDDAIYWVPSEPGQQDYRTTVSIMCEDKNVLRMRVRRLSHPRAPVLDPFPRTAHVLGNVTVTGEKNGEVHCVSAFVMSEFRNDQTQVFSGHCLHVLRRANSGFEIAQKRIDLLNCNGLNGVITLPF